MGNSLKTIYARITTNSSAITALENIGISMNKMDGEAKNSAELIEELAGRWDSLSDAERRNTAVGVAGIYQLSRFNALMNGYSTAQDAATTSAESYNSAAREQEKYNQSLEARINRLNTAWYELSNTLGQTIIYDAIVVGTSALEGLTKVGGTAGGSIITLSATLGVLGGAIALLSNRYTRFSGDMLTSIATQKLATTSSTTLTGRLWMLIGGINAETASQIANTAATNANTGAKVGATAATTALSVALRGLLAATGVGLVLMGIGVAAGVLINRFSEAKQASEELESYMNKNTSALTDNKEEIDKLLVSLEKLRNNKNRSTEEEQEYVNIQNRLAELYPALVKSVDANGNAHIKSSEAIAKEIEVTKELVQLERELTRARAKDTFKDNNKQLSNLEREIKTAKDTLKYLGKHDSGNHEAIAKWRLELFNLESQYADSSKEIQYNIMEIADSWLDAGEDIESVIKNQIQESLNELDFSNLSDDELADFSKKLSRIMQEMNVAFKNDDSSAFESANKSLGNLFATFELAEKGSNGLSTSFDKLKESANVKDVFDEANQALDEHGNVVDNATQAHEEFVEGMERLKDSISNINGILEDYNETGQISAETIYDLVLEYPQLLAYINDEGRLIQELTKIRDEDVNAAQLQLSKKIDDSEEFYNANLKMIEQYFAEHFKFYKGDLSQFKNLAQAKADVEVQLINQLAKKWGEYYGASAHYYNKNTGQFQVDNWAVGSASGQAAVAANKELAEARKAFEKISISQIDLDFSKIGTSLDKVGSSASKAGSSVDKATTQSIYVTDEYKLAMDALNSAMAKQNALRDEYSDHSDNYRKAIQGEIDLLEKQLKLQKEQANSLRNQINSGKIKQTGSVSVPTTSTTTSSGGTVSVNGWGGNLTSKQGMRYHPVYKKNMYHAGIDLASPKGTRLDSHVSGKVIGQSYNSRSGNYVQIQDANGNKHFFAHLDKAIAKLGDTIVAGQQIGTIGNTGASKGAHLHYEVKDKNGKYLDAATFAKEARTGKVKTTTTSTVQSTSQGVVDTGQQAVDDALSTLYSLEADIVSTQEQIEAKLEEIRQSFLNSFTYRKGVFDDLYNRESAHMRNADKWSKKYNDTLWRQIDALEKKQKVQQEEKAYIEQQLASGELNERQVDELTARYGELLVSIQDLDSNIWEHQLKKMDKFVSEAERATNVIDYMTKMTETLSQGTERYGKYLDDISEQLRIKKQANEAELKGLMDLVAQNKISGESLQGVIDRIQTLRIGIQDLANEIQNNNFEIIMNIKTKSDENIDDIDYDLEKSKIIQSYYTEGSALWNQELEKQIEYQTEIMKLHDETRRKLKAELLLHETTAERRKEIYETIEDESLAYLNASKAIEDLRKQAEEAKENKLEQIANDVIDRIKDYWNQRKDEEMMRLDDLLEAETDVHEKRMKMLRDEMDLYRKNVEEKLKLIDQQEAERDYNMEMDDLESERDKVQNQINLLMLDNSNEAKAKRKKLQEQLDKIDKDIAERKHDRDITLQKESINQNLEDKEEEISIREELETERHESEIERINREREYWEKYYEDRLNDEREFERIRQTIISGSFDEIKSLMNQYADQLEGTMWKLEVALEGTTKRAGTAIRQNVIDRLREAFDMIEEFNNSQIIDPTTGLDGANDKVISDPFDPNKGKDELVQQDVSRNNDKEKLSQGDLKVLTAKYMNEQLYFDTEDPTDKWWVKYKADTLAATGRQEGSTIRADQTLASVLNTLSKEDLQRLAKYAKELQATYLNKPDHQRHMTDWANKIASLDTGGLIKSTNFGGVDGKGGKMAILHNDEVVMNAVDTKSLIKNIQVSDGLAKTLHAMQNSMSQWINNLSPTLSGVGSAGGINIEFTGDIINSNSQTGTSLANNLVNGIRNRGGRI